MSRQLPSVLLDTALRPFSWLYAGIVGLRNIAFDQGWRLVESQGVSILSVGNLTAGGTGKTPLVAWLVAEAQARGKSVGIVSRGYGGLEKGPARVPVSGDEETARRFGDEPTWFAARFPKVPVFICGDRVAAVRALLAESDVDLIIADDGFQHRRLARSLDIVVLDASEPWWHYRPLPLGRMREGFSSLKRAQVICFTKINLPGASLGLTKLHEKVDALFGNADKPILMEFEARIKKMISLAVLGDEHLEKMASEFRGRAVLLVSAIGRPDSFSELFRLESGSEIKDHVVFQDHHHFVPTDLELIQERARANAVEAIVITEKDATKLVGWKSSVPVWIAKLEVSSRNDVKGFYEIFDRVLF